MCNLGALLISRKDVIKGLVNRWVTYIYRALGIDREQRSHFPIIDFRDCDYRCRIIINQLDQR
jgi:hypothetical protein